MTGIRVSDALAGIESELKAIWAPDAQGAARPHATTLNLVAVHGLKEADDFVGSVDDVAARMSARTFVIKVDPRLEPWALDAEVSAVCRLEPGSGREAVCAERLNLRFGAVAAKRAGSVLEALMESSLPTALVVGPGAHGAVIDALGPSMDSIVFDSRELGLGRASELAEATQARVEDLAFVRIRRWREMTARFFDDVEVRPSLWTIASVVIEHTPRPDHAGAEAEAELYVAWLGSRLGWRFQNRTLLDASGKAVKLELRVREHPSAIPGSLSSLELRARRNGGEVAGRVFRTDDGEHLTWELDAPCTHAAARRFATPHREPAELIERAIRNVSGDQLVRETLRFAKNWKSAA